MLPVVTIPFSSSSPAAVVFQNLANNNTKQTEWKGLTHARRNGLRDLNLPKHVEYVLMITLDHVVIPNGLFEK